MVVRVFSLQLLIFHSSILNFHLAVHSSLCLFFFPRTSFISFLSETPFPAWYINWTLIGVFFVFFDRGKMVYDKASILKSIVNYIRLHIS